MNPTARLRRHMDLDPANGLDYDPAEREQMLELFASANLRLSQKLDPMDHEEACRDLARAAEALGGATDLFRCLDSDQHTFEKQQTN